MKCNAELVIFCIYFYCFIESNEYTEWIMNLEFSFFLKNVIRLSLQGVFKIKKFMHICNLHMYLYVYNALKSWPRGEFC